MCHNPLEYFLADTKTDPASKTIKIAAKPAIERSSALKPIMLQHTSSIKMRPTALVNRLSAQIVEDSPAVSSGDIGVHRRLLV
jgi:hypothetical protein